MTLLAHRCFSYPSIFCHRVIHLHFTEWMSLVWLHRSCSQSAERIFHPLHSMQTTAEVELAGVVPDVSPTLMSFRASCWGRGVSAPLSVSMCVEKSRGGLGVRRLISLIDCKHSMTGLLMRMYKHGPRHLKLCHQGGDWSGPSILTLLHQALECGWSSWTVLMERDTPIWLQ